MGEDIVLDLSLADFAEVKGYGFTLGYDPEMLEFVEVVAPDNPLGAAELAQPRVLSQADGEVAIAAYGEPVVDGEIGLSLVFRATTDIESGVIELTSARLSDPNYTLNQVMSLGAVEIETRPQVFALADNYPNPFNPETTIKYELPAAAQVRLEVFNVVGQVVRTLVAEPQSAGRYVVQWDATNDNQQSLSSGVYFYRIHAGDFLKVKKMLLLK